MDSEVTADTSAAHDTEEIPMPSPRRPSSPARHKRHTPSRTHRGAAIAVTGVVSAGMVVAGAGPVAAAEKPVSQARGYFLSGSALGVNLDTIVELEDARAKNYGGHTDRELNPLSATLLNSLHIPIGPLNLLEDNGLIELGAVNQAAIARSNGSAVGASGAVTDSGAIAVDGDDDVPASNATVDLGDALGDDVLGSLLDVDLEIGALSASAKQAKGKNGKQTGDYQIADLVLELQSPLLSGLLAPITTQLSGVQGQVDGAINTLGLLGGLVEVSSLPDLAARHHPRWERPGRHQPDHGQDHRRRGGPAHLARPGPEQPRSEHRNHRNDPRRAGHQRGRPGRR